MIKKLFLFVCISVVLCLAAIVPNRTLAAEPNIEQILPVELNGLAGDSRANLSWVDQNSTSALGYQITYSTEPTTLFDPLGSNLVNIGDLRNQTVQGLQNQTEYYFAVARINASGALEGQSNVIQLKPLDQTAPITTLITDPSIPQGQNGWFITLPTASLTANEQATTYYQWNATSDFAWQVYNSPLSPVQGENILYYYSVDQAGNIEQIKWQIIKVDTVLPASPVLQGYFDEVSGGVVLSWGQVEGAIYQIWRTDSETKMIARLTEDQLSYLDKSVLRSSAYQYSVIAEDMAGNLATSNTFLVQVPQVQEIVPVVSNVSVTPTIVKTIKPAIGEGVSTVAQNEGSQSVEAPKAVEGAKDQQEQEENSGWSRLLVALSILIIAVGVAVGGFYGYEWMNARSQDQNENTKNTDSSKRNNRW